MANQETKKNTKRKSTASAQEEKAQGKAGSSKQITSSQGDNYTEKQDCLFMKMYQDHPNTVVLTLLGVITALCFILIGFWATILIILFTGAGFIYGQYRDKELWVYYVLKRLLK